MSSDSEYVNNLDLPPSRVTLEYLKLLAKASGVFAVLWFFWRRYVLVDFSDIAGSLASVPEGLASVWFIFAWGCLVTLLVGIILRKQPRSHEPSTILTRGFWLSINAGVFEELIFRWFLFASAMVTIPFLNWITFGLAKWVFTTILVPLANFTTFGVLEAQLLEHESWVLGAAIVTANVAFLDEHSYQGLLGLVNSWFMGMVFFFLMFNHGLIVAIVAHILYDIVIDITGALTTTWRPRYSRRRTLEDLLIRRL